MPIAQILTMTTAVLTKVKVDIPASEPVWCQVYKFNKANWDQLWGGLLAKDETYSRWVS